MLLYSEHSHRTCSTDSHSHSQKKQALPLFLVLCLPSSSFRPWVPDLNLNKSLEPMSETPCTVSTSCTQNLLSTYLYSTLFQKLLYKNYPYLFSIISKTKLLFPCFFLNLKAQYLNHSIQLHYKFLRSNIKSFLPAANNTASNALD